MTRSLIPACFAFTLTACAADGPADPLTADERVAVDAAIDDLQPLRADLPVEDDELEDMAIAAVLEAHGYTNCRALGVLSGVWYDEALEAAFEGSWFELGTGTRGGTLDGAYGEGAFSGTFGGTDSGTIAGEYGDGLFLGEWAALDAEGATTDTGELIGRYEHRNDFGGYYFGLWGRCDG
jgi:hypothetical protein